MMNMIYKIRHELSKEISDRFTSPSGKYNPMAFSPMGGLSAHTRKKKKKKRVKSQDLRKLGNYRKILNLVECPASLQEIKLWQQQLKNTLAQVLNFSCSVQFYWIFLLCSKHFIQDCSFQKFQRNLRILLEFLEPIIALYSNLFCILIGHIIS